MTVAEIIDIELESTVDNEVCHCLYCGDTIEACECAGETSLPVEN